MNNYLELLPNADASGINSLLTTTHERLKQNKKGFRRFRDPFEAISHLKAATLDFSQDTVVIGSKEELSDSEHQQVYDSLRAFMPWRKGPFSIFGIEVDAEWRSDRKWNRLQPHLPDLSGKIIADIGCNNGYYMFRMAPSKPRLVLGFEPMIQHHFSFRMLNALAQQTNLVSEPLGVENIGLFQGSFDVIFLMGILYHHASPIDLLRGIQAALKPGGSLVLESQTIAGQQPMALFPEKTYAKVPGTYFVPTTACILNWLQRVGFKNIKHLTEHPMTSAEQRRTDWMLFESYADFIDPADSALTIEGYPAPQRTYIIAEG